MIFSHLLNMQSHPSWVCGLKLNQNDNESTRYWVTPFVGVWIETSSVLAEGRETAVTPFVGVWIETYYDSFKS